MPFKYSCFISYPNVEGELIKQFVEDLRQSLTSSLSPYLDEKVYIDTERLKPGHLYNDALAKSLCHSVCMIVVYMPVYERHSYCMREFAAMEELEKKRFALLGRTSGHDVGMIIPIIVRSDDDLPEKLTASRHYCDFRKFTLATPDIKRNAEYVDEVEKIAKNINKLYKQFEASQIDPCAECGTYDLPEKSQVLSWRVNAPPPTVAPFPGRS